MRVTQQSMFTNILYGMNTTQSDYMQSINQSATQKRINRPSDDPAGMANILAYRAGISATSQYLSNTDAANEWLTATRGALTTADGVISQIQVIAEAQSQGLYTQTQRDDAADVVRNHLASLMNLANTRNSLGDSVFAGQNYHESAFEMGLTVTANDEAIEDIHLQVEGALENTALVKFPPPPEAVPPVVPAPTHITLPQDPLATPPGVDVTYEWTEDGGATWNTGVIPAGADSFAVGASIVTIPEGEDMTVEFYDPYETAGDNNGTQLYVRPAVIYNGYDDNATPTVDRYGTLAIPSDIVSTVTGTLDENVLIEFPNGVDMSVAGTHEYSYSTDGGQTWEIGSAEVMITPAVPAPTPPATMPPASPESSTMRVVIAGGFIDMDVADTALAADLAIPAGAQALIRPQMTELEYEIAEGEYIGVTNVGKNIFGGLFSPNGSDTLEPMYDGDERNLFESIGRLIGYLETGNSDGIGDAVEELKIAHAMVTTENARLGGKDNRLEVNANILDMKNLNQNSRKSAIEDVNLPELLARLTQQQLAYNSILQSSATIMQTSLLNYL